MFDLVSSISDIGKEELEKVLTEADAKGQGEVLRNIWKMDVEERLQYYKDQKKSGMCIILNLFICSYFIVVTGRKGNRWSMITFRMGMLALVLICMCMTI